MTGRPLIVARIISVLTAGDIILFIKEKNMIYSVALDGPGGAGKSSVAKRIAQKRGIVYVDTGAMYRAVALYMTEHGVDVSDEEAVKEHLNDVHIRIKYSDGVQLIYLDDRDVSADIRRPEISMAASTVSAHGSVRAFLLQTQRNMARTQSVIMDGRDIGTVVLPDARVKVFLTADSRVRAQRRLDELLAKGQDTDFETVLADIEQRDWQDTHRENAPLMQADDAVLLDTSDLTFRQVVDKMMEIIDKKTGE